MLCVGRHIIAEVYQVPESLTTDSNKLNQLLCAAATAAGAEVLHTYFHDFHPKDGHDVAGVTGVIALSESHISVHTWPEHGYMAIDVFMCGDANPSRVIEALEDAGLTHIDVKEISRPYHP
jgi:S-adenosylmethionine decarboxylase